jgi:hypothetical protein
MIVGIGGFAGAGKDTLGSILIENYLFEKASFAGTLKDACANIFSWDRELLEGKTTESRIWRETKDVWWSKCLGINNFTPRFALQFIGTDVMRDHFHPDLWLLSLAKKFDGKDVVVTDCRFPNEFNWLKKNKYPTIWIRRDPEPFWILDGVKAARGDNAAVERLNELKIHISEWNWLNCAFDHIIYNNGSIDQLENQVENLVKLWNNE